jgi:hypothetical protein
MSNDRCWQKVRNHWINPRMVSALRLFTIDGKDKVEIIADGLLDLIATRQEAAELLAACGVPDPGHADELNSVRQLVILNTEAIERVEASRASLRQQVAALERSMPYQKPFVFGQGGDA